MKGTSNSMAFSEFKAIKITATKKISYRFNLYGSNSDSFEKNELYYNQILQIPYFCVFIRSRSDSKKKFECLGKFKLLTNRSEHESCHENWLYNLRYSIYNYSLEIVDFEIEISYYDCFEGTFSFFPQMLKKLLENLT